MQNFMQAKNEMDTQTQYAQKGMENNLLGASGAAEKATQAYEDLKQAAQDSGNSSIDLSDIQTA